MDALDFRRFLRRTYLDFVAYFVIVLAVFLAWHDLTERIAGEPAAAEVEKIDKLERQVSQQEKNLKEIARTAARLQALAERFEKFSQDQESSKQLGGLEQLVFGYEKNLKDSKQIAARLQALADRLEKSAQDQESLRELGELLGPAIDAMKDQPGGREAVSRGLKILVELAIKESKGGAGLERLAQGILDGLGQSLGARLGELLLEAANGRAGSTSAKPVVGVEPQRGREAVPADVVDEVLVVRFSTSGSVDDRGALKDTVIPKLKVLAAGRGDCALQVDGYADTVGHDRFNLRLSQRRIDQTVAALAAEFKQVPIATRAWGERRLEIWTPDQTGEIANRQVRVRIRCGSN